MKRNVTFTFEYEDKAWTVTAADGPGAIGIHEEPYEALLDCAYTLFSYAQDPEDAPRIYQSQYHQLNLDFHPYDPDSESEEDEEDEPRVLSPVQQERARRIAEFLKDVKTN